MKFEFEGLSYIIEFQREQKVPAGSIYGKPRTYTTARILQVTGPNKTDRKVVRTATVGYNPVDRFSYEEGRKIALVRALYDAPTKGGGAPLLGTPLTRAFRKAVWTAYFGRF